MTLVAAAVITVLTAPLSWAQSQPSFNSAAQGVSLIAQLPGTAQVAWSVQPVPQTMLDPGQTAEVVVLQESLTLGRGQTLDAKCQVITDPDAGAAFFPSQPQDMVSSFLGTDSSTANGHGQTFPLLTNFDPAHGSTTDSQSIVIFRNSSKGSPSGIVKLTIAAL
jgi:hypothetical protein